MEKRTENMNIIGKTIEYEYSPYAGVDDIFLDICDNIKNGFTVAMIDCSHTISCHINNTYKLKVCFKRKEN